MWNSHWGLERDPFAESDGLYVSLPTHDDAVGRLTRAIESPSARPSSPPMPGWEKARSCARHLLGCEVQDDGLPG